MLYVLAPNSDLIETRKLSLPVSFPINSYAARYVVRTGSPRTMRTVIGPMIKDYPDSITDSMPSAPDRRCFSAPIR